MLIPRGALPQPPRARPATPAGPRTAPAVRAALLPAGASVAGAEGGDASDRSGRPRYLVSPDMGHAGLAADQVADEEQHVGRPLGQSPHEVRVPVRAVRGRDHDALAERDQIALQLRAHAVEHLKLVPVAGNPLL